MFIPKFIVIIIRIIQFIFIIDSTRLPLHLQLYLLYNDVANTTLKVGQGDLEEAYDNTVQALVYLCGDIVSKG